MTATTFALSALAAAALDFDRFHERVSRPGLDVRAFMRVVLETAAEAEIPGQPTSKQFAGYFTDRAQKFTDTPAGKAALLFETHLLREGGPYIERFVETVLDGGTFQAVFQGSLSEQELKQLVARTEKFVAFEVEVKAGDRDHAHGIVSRLTILRCKPVSTTGEVFKQEMDQSEKRKGEKAKRATTSPLLPTPATSTLLPESRAAYEAVADEGGVSASALAVLLGTKDLNHATFDGGYVAVKDANGVRWYSEQGRTWIPRPTTFVENDEAVTSDPQFSSTGSEGRESLPAPLPFSLEEEEESVFLRSQHGSYTVFEAAAPGHGVMTVFVCPGEAYVLPHEIEVIRDLIEDLEEAYGDYLSLEADRCIEAVLHEVARDVGWPAARPEALQFSLLTEGLEERDDYLAGVYGIWEAEPPLEGEEETTDRMDEPEFYRNDLQTYFDMLVTTGATEVEAKRKLRSKFGPLKGLVITPTGEVRSPGVIDRPNPPPPLLPGMGAEEPLPPEPPPEPAAAASTGAASAPQESASLGESLGTETALAALPTVEDAFLWFCTYEDDAYLEEFPRWVKARCPHLTPALESWRPTNVPLAESRLRDRDMYRAMWEGGAGSMTQVASKSRRRRSRATERREPDARQQELYEKWKRLVNLSTSSLMEMLGSAAFRRASTGVFKESFDLARDSGRVLARMRAMPVECWTGGEWNWAARQVKLIERHRRQRPLTLVEDGLMTEKHILLRSLGHDPTQRKAVPLAEIQTLLDTDPRKAAVLIDALPGPGPHQLEDGYDGRKGPNWKPLQKGKVKLTDEERAEVLKSKATWNFGPDGAPSPAVWKSVVNGKTWYVTNTHRAFNSAPTLKGAIERYHKFIKSTA